MHSMYLTFYKTAVGHDGKLARGDSDPALSREFKSDDVVLLLVYSKCKGEKIGCLENE